MSSANKPSIFTARNSFLRRSTEQQQQQHHHHHHPQQRPATPTRAASFGSPPFRRQSTPEPIERSRVHAATLEEAPAYLHIAAESRRDPSAAYDRNATNHHTNHTYNHNHSNSVGRTSPAIWKGPRPPGDEALRRSLSPASLAAAKGRSVSASHTLLPETPPREYNNHRRGIFSESAADHNIARKRPAVAAPPYEFDYDPRGPTSEPASKRQKINVKSRSKHYLDSFSGPTSTGVYTPDNHPPSPLFFSHSPRTRPTLPPRFSSAEAGAKMLSKARMEDSHMKTVSLARGIVTTPSSQTGVSRQHSGSGWGGSMERRSTGRSSSPDSAPQAAWDAGSSLSSIGITELLEQDERPTFIVDLSMRDNYGPGPLYPIFANYSLKSYTHLEALVSGRSSETTGPSPGTFLQFKAWLLSAAIHGQSLDVCLPNFIFANLSWSCSTLRKKLRIISGAFLATPGGGRPHELRASYPPFSSTEPRGSDPPVSAPPIYQEPSDYFGAAARHISRDASSAATEAVPSIESLPPARFPSAAAHATSPGDANGKVVPPDPDLASGSLLLSADAEYPPSAASLPAMSTTSITPDKSSARIDDLNPDSPCFDWTRLPVSDAMPQHIQFARSIDWTATALGPIETWSPDLRQMCNLIMASPHPAAMYWGDDLIAIYNEAYVMLAGQKHPKLMGQSYRVAWAEIWDDVKDVFDSAQMTGEATMKDDDCLFIRRSNHLEETYFSWSIIPMVGKDGTVMGLYNPAFEKTRRKIAERRMLTLREVGERTANARDVKAFWAQVLDSFEFNEYDSPFLLLYSVGDESDSDSSSIHSNSIYSGRQCILEGKLGIPDGHPAAAQQIDLKSGTEGFGLVFKEIFKTDKPVLLDVGSKELPETLVQGLDWRGFGDRVRSVVVCPIHPTTGENILGFLVLGVNPRRPYDEDYSLFVQLLSRQLATSLASVVLFEEEIRRGQRAAKLAALDRIELSEQLAQRTQEANDSETKFTRMAEFAPVGMVIARGPDGRITYANDTWYDISRVPKNSAMADTWMEFVNPLDLEKVETFWEDLTVRKKLVSAEFRFKAQWEDRNGNRGDTWVLFSGYPEKYDDGRLKSIFACFTNISQQKWAEGIQKAKMEEAVELKRQQENFIDITSHEMRNPLSAILQCSDEISSSLTKFRQSNSRVISDELLASCLDAAQIINLCSLHQKRIVDDILTLSKLDSQLLLVTPVDAQPLTVVQRALKMHEGELQASDIRMNFVVDQSYRDLDLDWVRLDPSRVLQVLINLTTNAIKFTGSESNRTISITISASRTRPSESPDAPVKYFPTKRKDYDVMAENEWGNGEKVYIHFSVRDTGRGLSPEEKKMLFVRFSQASPRTHVQYGGSGLGLFISRELTELQGGEIGVESEAGRGSVFAFYIVARRSSAPPDAEAATPDVESSGGLQRSASQVSLGVEKAVGAASAAGEGKVGKASTKTTQVKPNSAEPLHVLLVEDNLINQKVSSQQLRRAGCIVHVANNGQECLDFLEHTVYCSTSSSSSSSPAEGTPLSVILLDLEMPVMDGLECIRRIRTLQAEGGIRGHVPVIAVTANARAEQVMDAKKAGMDQVVTKPFQIQPLLQQMRTLVAEITRREAGAQNGMTRPS